MPRLFPKITVMILLGIVFLLGGVGTASALTAEQQAQINASSAITSGSNTTTTGGGAGATGTATDVYMYGTNGTRFPSLSACQAASGGSACVKTSTQFNQANDTYSGSNSTLGFLFDSFKCSITSPGQCVISFLMIGPTIFAYLVNLISAGLLMLGGYLFDYSLFLSLDKNFIVQTFIETLWTTMRDFSNMLFIFILLYTGIQTMLGIGKDWRGVVLKVVIVALLINFSLFFTKVVIDAGNVLAIGVYESMGSGPPGQKRDLSAELVKAFEPQTFTAKSAATDASKALIILVISTIINMVAAWAFFTTALIFVGRLMAFWFLMIISPFAFISIALPKGGIFGWWSSTLINQTFLAPVFLFCVYLILQVVNGGVLAGLTRTVGSGHGYLSDAIIAPALIATLIAFTLIRAKDLAKSMAGEFGEAGGKLLSGALTTASVGARIGTAVATGGASMMVGGLNIGGKQLIKARGEGSAWNKFSKESTVGKFLRNSSFDVRNIGGDNSIFGHVAGGVIKQGVGQLGIGKGVGEGGVKASQDKQKKINQEKALKEALEEAQGLEMTDTEKAALYQAQADEQRAKRAENEAKIAHTESPEAQEVKKQAKAIEAIQEVATMAQEEIAKAQKAWDEGNTDSGSAEELALLQQLVDAKKNGEPQITAFKEAAKDLAKAKDDFATSGAAKALEKATEALTVATEKKNAEQQKVDTENTSRRHKYAEKVEKGGWFVGGVYSGGNTATANKIREGLQPDASKKDLEKYLKELMGGGGTPKVETGGEPKH